MRRRMLILIAAAWMLAWPRAGAPALLPALDTSSPRAVFATLQSELPRIAGLHADYVAAPSNAGELAILRAMLRLGAVIFDLDRIPPATRVKHAAVAIGYLNDILVRMPPIPPGDIPGPPYADGSPPARWTVPGTELQLRRITEGPRSGDWVFTDDTLARLPEFHAQIVDEPVRNPFSPLTRWRDAQRNAVGPMLARIRGEEMPPVLRRTVFEAAAWKVIGAVVVWLAVLLLVLGWARIVRRLAADAAPWRCRAAWLTLPVWLGLLTLLAHVFIGWELVLGGPLFEVETLFAISLLFVAAAWAAWQLCWLVVEAIIASPFVPDNSYDANLLRLIARVASLVAAGGVLIYGANFIGVPALGLVAGVSVGGIALALAAQSTIENLFGGVSLFADRPFRVGDTIRFGDSHGTVEAIGPRSTRIRGLDGTLTAVPNADLAKTRVTNFTVRERFLFRHRFGLRYETPAAQLRWLVAELARRVATHPEVELDPGRGLPRVHLVGLGESSIDIEIYAHVRVTTLARFLPVQEALILEVMAAVEEAGTGFAFPSRTAYLARDPGLDAEAGRRIVALMAEREAPGAGAADQAGAAAR